MPDVQCHAIDVSRDERLVTLPTINTTQVPFFRYREIHYLNAMDRAYSDWHKLHSLADQREEWGMWVHTFDGLSRPRSTSPAHPEYFTLHGNRRIPNGQLCLSNPELFSVLTEALRERMARQPVAHYWSVSQNDNFNECQCDSCRRRTRVTARVRGPWSPSSTASPATFPDKTISTLAYNYTRTAPTTSARSEREHHALLHRMQPEQAHRHRSGAVHRSRRTSRTGES